MFAIARAENGTCEPKRHNLTASETHRDAKGNVICVGSYGALQVGCLHYGKNDDVNDLATNIRVAYRVYTERKKWAGDGYTAWTMYLNTKYRKNL